MESSASRKNFRRWTEKTTAPHQIQGLDRFSIQEAHVPGLLLMERASLQLTMAALAKYRTEARNGVRILVGKGNNGGDGLAMGRHLVARGYDVEVLATYEPRDEPENDATRNAHLLSNLIALGTRSMRDFVAHSAPFDGLWIDSLLGTGFRGRLRSPLDEIIDGLNARNELVMAVDIPSGLDGVSGVPSPTAVRAQLTGTLGCAKPAFRQPSAAAYMGQVVVLPIGWPDRTLEKLEA